MSTATRQPRTPLGVFPDRLSPRLYDRIIEVLRDLTHTNPKRQRGPAAL